MGLRRASYPELYAWSQFYAGTGGRFRDGSELYALADLRFRFGLWLGGRAELRFRSGFKLRLYSRLCKRL